MKKNTILVLCMALLASVNTNAQIVTDRPDQTESAATVQRGALQMESGIMASYTGNNQLAERQIVLPTNLFRYGLTNGIELRLMHQFESVKFSNQTLQGMSDLEIGAKFMLLKTDNQSTEMAFLTHLTMPTGSTGLTWGKFGTINKLCVAHTISEKAEIGYNIGYDYFGEGKGNFVYSLAYGKSVNDKVGFFIETYGEVENLNQFISNFDTGITYLLNDNFQFDFSFGVGVNHRMNFISAGFSWLLPEN
jgi:hypothetical protein